MMHDEVRGRPDVPPDGDPPVLSDDRAHRFADRGSTGLIASDRGGSTVTEGASELSVADSGMTPRRRVMSQELSQPDSIMVVETPPRARMYHMMYHMEHTP